MLRTCFSSCCASRPRGGSNCGHCRGNGVIPAAVPVRVRSRRGHRLIRRITSPARSAPTGGERLAGAPQRGPQQHECSVRHISRRRVDHPTNAPTTGYAVSLVIAGAEIDEAQLAAAIADIGAEVRSSETVEGGLEALVACSGTAQQAEVLSVVEQVDGVDSVSSSDTTFDLHVDGKIVVSPRTPLVGPDELAMAYTPGVGRVSTHIAEEPSAVWRFTGRSNAVAVLSNGTAVLGLGDIGPEAAMPVMEGKAVLFKQFAGVDAYPVCVDALTVDDVVAVGAAIAPTFGGINLEDIKAPECFEIEERLQEMLTSRSFTTTSMELRLLLSPRC